MSVSSKVEHVWKNNKVARRQAEHDELYAWYEKNKADLIKTKGLINIKNPSGAPVDEVLEIGDFTLFRCRETGFMFFNPRMTEKAGADFFAQDFLDKYYQEVDDSFEIRKELGYKDICAKIAGFIQPGARVLEIGCGTAPKLRILRDDHGMQVQGVEISPLAQKYHQRHGLSVQIGSIEDADFPSQNFDMIFMWSVADHFADPIAVFKKCFDLTKPGGVFLIASINTDGFDHAITGLDNVAYRPPGRVNFYNIRSLKDHLQRAGYTITQSYTPGKLDVAMVKDYWQGGGQNNRNDFLENLVMNEDEKTASAFQAFLSENSLSGFQVMVAKK